jgi:hypothetical protein
MSRPRMSFPDEAELAGCSPWCRPLHMVEAASAGHAFAKYFVVDHFMCMGMIHRQGRPNLILNKHILTRRYLNLDAAGHAYRYLPPPPGSSSNGQYRPHADLVTAIDNLRLFEMPWLTGSGFDCESGGLDWDERWRHPDVQAWIERRSKRAIR